MKPAFFATICCLFATLSISLTHPSSSHQAIRLFSGPITEKDSSKLFPTIPEHLYDSIFTANSDYFSDGFDFPVGKPDGKHYFKANYFGQKNHLGEDWNGKGGGNSDLGDPAYSIADGLVTFSAKVCCGWGNVVRIAHRLADHPEYEYVESVYAHLDELQVEAGELVQRGYQIGTIGNADGKYKAHLHLELRTFINMSLGPGYSNDHFGYTDPTGFIEENRPR